MRSADLPIGVGSGRETGATEHRLPSRRDVTLYPQSPRQGDTLFMLFRPGAGVSEVRLTWDGRSVPAAQVGEGFIGMIGIRIIEPPGPHTLRLTFNSATGKEGVETRSVSVRRTAWPVQRLTMPRSKERLYTFPGARKEDAEVTAATHTFSEELLWRGRFLLPAHGRLATPFGVKRIRNGHTVYYHRGMDIAAPTGTPVVAPNAARVVLARVFKKYGHTLVLDHGQGVTTLYLHMSALAVHEGDRVQRGQLVGRIGAEGVATGPHLHWSLDVHGTSVSPAFWTHLPDSITAGLGHAGAGVKG